MPIVDLRRSSTISIVKESTEKSIIKNQQFLLRSSHGQHTIVTPDLDAIVSEIEIAAPPERVFRALTDAKQLIHWWGDQEACRATVWEMDARPGGKWRFEASDPSGELVINGVREFKAHGEILEYSPPRYLVYTWIANWHEKPDLVTVVTWDLTATRNGTHVKMTHSGLAEIAVARKDYTGGWPGVVELLKKYAEQQ